MYESRIAQMQEIASLLQRAQDLYESNRPAAPGGLELERDLAAAKIRAAAMLSHFRFSERRNARTLFGLVHQARA